jgi:mannose-6-phosphate isomerase-like protein (cupin superfamily)
MNAINIESFLKSVDRLEITEQTTSDDAGAAMKILGNFNQYMLGLVSFSGLTPWERHPDDELLHILAGEVDVAILADNGPSKVTLQAGSIFVVPGGLWHKQDARKGVKLLFVTSQAGNEASDSEDPRVGG